MRTIVRRLPVDIQLLVLAKLTIAKIFKFKFTEEVLCHRALEKRFQEACRRNGISRTKETENIPHALILRRFFYDLRQFDFAEHKRKQWGNRSPESLCDVTNRSILCERDFYYGHEDADMGIGVKIVLIRPKNEIKRAIMPRQTTIVGCDIHEEGETPVVSLVLRNGTASVDDFVIYEEYGPYLCDRKPSITFDEYDRIYYCEDNLDYISVFRMDIEVDGNCELVAEFPHVGNFYEDPRSCVFIAVGGNMLYIVGGNVLCGYNMMTKNRNRFQIPCFRPPILLTAHETGVFVDSLSEDCLLILILRPGKNNFFYTLVITKMQLNKHTYLYISQRGEKFELHIVSLVNENVVDYVVQECEKDALYTRYNDHIFAVETNGGRHVWYIEQPGVRPTHLFGLKLKVEP